MNIMSASCVSMSCDPTDPRRHRKPRLHGGKYATGHCPVDYQADSETGTTGSIVLPNSRKPKGKRSIRIGTWNVKGLVTQPGKLDIIEREMQSRNIDILGLSEVHWRGSGHFVTENGNTVYYSGSNEKSENGVAFIVPKRWQ